MQRSIPIMGVLLLKWRTFSPRVITPSYANYAGVPTSMNELGQRESWEEIRLLLDAQDVPALNHFLDTLTPGAVARAFTRLDESERHDVLMLLGPEEAADLIEELSDTQGSDLVEELAAEEAAAIVDEMESHHRADILGEMDEDDAEAILRRMDPEEAEDARKLLEYGEETAGGIMATEFVCYAQETSVGDVIRDLRDNAERYSDFGVQYAYVNSERGTLVGVVRLRDLILAPAKMTLGSLMIVNPLYVLADTSLEDLEQFFDRYPFYSVPVTDEAQQMLGVVRRAEAEEALSENIEKSFMRFGGIIGGEELRSMPTQERVTRRMVWLGINLPLSMLAAAVIPIFEETIVDFPVLLFFIPIIGNLCGCSGNQAVAVSIRELTLGLINPSDMIRVLRKELQVGFINGFMLGSVVIIVAFSLDRIQGYQVPYLALFIGLAFFINTMVAVCLGGVIPLILKRFKADPALGAPPIQTTLTDMVGLFIMFALAAIAMHFGFLEAPPS